MKNKLNKNAKCTFYKARVRKNDWVILNQKTGYSQSHICNVVAGRRSPSEQLANAMYALSNRRDKNPRKVIA